MKVKVIAVLLVLFASITFAASMSVQVRTSKVRATPSQLGRIVATVKYGDAIQTGEAKRGWYAVTTKDGKKGWLHESALSRKPIKMRAGTKDVATGVSSDEVALAGKGFNEQVEAKLKADKAMDAAACIGCGACVAACPNSSAMLFSAAKISHLNLLPQGETERFDRAVLMVDAMEREGFGGCTNIGECEAVCPKEISLDFIAKMNRDYILGKMRGAGNR